MIKLTGCRRITKVAGPDLELNLSQQMVSLYNLQFSSTNSLLIPFPLNTKNNYCKNVLVIVSVVLWIKCTSRCNKDHTLTSGCCVLCRRSRRQLMAPLNKDCQFGFPPETGEDPPDLDTAIAYYQLDDTSNGVFPPLPVRGCLATGKSNSGISLRS